MGKQLSYSGLGNKFLHEMRDKIKRSEDRVDLENQFSQIVSNFLRSAFHDKNIAIRFDDIILDPEARDHYSLSRELKRSRAFMETWNSSDIPDYIKKFACCAHNRYVHLEKHLEKTEKKIRY